MDRVRPPETDARRARAAIRRRLRDELDAPRARAQLVRFVLLVLALLAELWASLALLDAIGPANLRHAIGLVAVGLVFYLLGLQPLPGPPRSRRRADPQ